MENYDMDGALLIEASEGGDPDAMVCELAVSQGRGFASRELRLLYRLYRLREREPEGLDALARRLSRRDLAAALANAHDFSPELDAFETDWRGCPRYDPIARELLLRAEPGEDMKCLPRGRR